MTAPDPRPLPKPTKTDLARVWREVNGGNRSPSDVDAFVDAVLATLTALASAAAPAQGVPEGFVPRSAVEPLLTALRFYARGEHYHLDDDEDFDTVSGEPDNWLMSGREGSATMVEDGRVARFALWGEPMNWIDGDDNHTPQPIEGEALAASPPPPAQEAPIDMVLHCPACGAQHIDAPEAHDLDRRFYPEPWTNPPHRSHLCHGCGHIWRPADVPTNGVAAVKTKGKNDSPAQEARQPDGWRPIETAPRDGKRPLRRGGNGVCARTSCECEREGLGDQCIWLRPAPGQQTGGQSTNQPG